MSAPQSPRTDAFNLWPSEYQNHETDDQGFPLCRCEACREKSIRRNAMEVALMFSGLLKEGHDERAEREDREVDYARGQMK